MKSPLQSISTFLSQIPQTDNVTSLPSHSSNQLVLETQVGLENLLPTATVRLHLLPHNLAHTEGYPSRKLVFTPQ